MHSNPEMPPSFRVNYSNNNALIMVWKCVMIRQLFKRLNVKESCLNFKNIDIPKQDSCFYARFTLYSSYEVNTQWLQPGHRSAWGRWPLCIFSVERSDGCTKVKLLKVIWRAEVYVSPWGISCTEEYHRAKAWRAGKTDCLYMTRTASFAGSEGFLILDIC